MDICKDFLHHIRKQTLEDVYLIFYDDIVPNLYDYVLKLSQIKFEDGSYHTFYGEVKHLINAFLSYYENTIDSVIRKADKYSNVTNREELLTMIQKTIDIQYDRQVFFSKYFLPVCTLKEKEIYEEIESTFEIHKQDMGEVKNKIEKLDKQDKVDHFAQEFFIITVKKTSELFVYTHLFISLMLSEHLKETKISLEEILLRIQNNLKKLEEERNTFLKELRDELYKKNKEVITISRRARKCSVETAEVAFSIKAIQNNIQNHKYTYPIQRVSEEVCYWRVRLEDFNFIADNLIRLKAEQENMQKQQEIYNKLRTTELPGSKKQCWMNMGENFRNRDAFVQEKIHDISKTLMTFFAIPGHDHILYWDHIGQFFLDSYNHQVYVFNHELNLCHVTCNGSFKQVSENVKYYFDVNGRYILRENGEKIYQCAPCLSWYKLGEDNILSKITEDCGHSERKVRECRRSVKENENVPPILPDVEVKNIKETLSTDVVKYLWSSFGHVLPEALHDVGRVQPRNPIQLLAHKILLHTYSKTYSELWKKKKEADNYRFNILKKRKEKAIVASKAWKAKQIKRRKPEESDDTDAQLVYDAYVAAQARMATLYDDDD